jgi:hypothetical protein
MLSVGVRPWSMTNLARARTEKVVLLITFPTCAVREALEHAKSVEDMLPLIKAIFDELGTKAERSLFDGE